MKLGALIGDRFRLEALAGQGAMGVVYRAVDQSTGATVALKVLSGTAGAESNVGRRFLQEAEVLASLEHDSIVRYIGHGVLPDAKPWLAMEWLIGESLSAKVKLAGALAVSPALALGAEVARALDAAHAKGIVHRDLKPSNLILLGGDPRKPKLLDFGIARVGLGSLTLAGDFLGTPGYIAPEQARADPSIDGRADLFALGCVLFYTLTGRPPFYGEDLPSVLLKLVLDEPTPIDEFRSDVPDDAAELLRSLLAKDRAGRPSNAGEVAAALTRLAAETASLAEAPRSQRAPQPEALGLTKSEHRLTCLVLARVNDASARRAADDAPPSSRAPELDALRRDLKALGGHLDVLVDGSAIVTFDSDPEGRAPSAREQAAQAARCAMLLHRARTRVAVVAGRVDAALDQPLARIIERAVSMTSTTSPGIRLDDVVAGLLDARFDVDSAGERHTLFGERLLASTGRTVLGQATPFVGRHEELALLLGRLERCIDEPRSSATLIVGAPGVGKSRLVAELLRRASDRDVDAWVSRGDPMRGGAPAALVRAALQIPEGEADAGAVDHVRAKVSELVRDPERAESVAEFVGEIVGVKFPDEGRVQLRAARHAPQLMGDRMLDAFVDLVAAACARRPVIAILEDAARLDASSSAFVEAARRACADQPLFVVAIGRPEIREALPSFLRDHDAAVIELPPLPAPTARKLARHVLSNAISGAGAARLDEIVERVVARAQGNAYYLEELLRDEGRRRGDEPSSPPTILAMVEARLDALSDDQRLILRAASLFGRTFWLSGVAELARLGADVVERELAALEREELVASVGESRFRGARAWTFTSEFVEEAAYARITAEDRARGHRLVGAWLLAAGESDAVVLAEHFSRGGDRASASVWLRIAAETAMESHDLARAIGYGERAIAAGASGAELGRIRLGLATAHAWQSEHELAVTSAKEAMDHLPIASSEWFDAAAERLVALSRLARLDELYPQVDEVEAAAPTPGSEPALLVALARAANEVIYAGQTDRADRLLRRISQIEGELTSADPIVQAWILRARSARADHAGNTEAELALLEACARSFELAGDTRNACFQRVNVAATLIDIGDYRYAERVLRGTLESSSRLGLRTVGMFANVNMGLVLTRMGRHDESLHYLSIGCDEADAQKITRFQGFSRIYRSYALMELGRPSEALSDAEAARDIAAKWPTVHAHALGAIARVLVALERPDEAMAAATAAVAELQGLGGSDEGEEIVLLAHAEAALALGRRSAAGEVIRVARGRLLARADRISQPAHRQNFLEKVPENRRTLELAAELLGDD